jgi:hypothetical protein
MFLGKWLYNLGKRHAYEQLRAELYLFIGQEPTRFSDPDFGMSESDASYKKRVDGWFEARKMLTTFFGEREERYKENDFS